MREREQNYAKWIANVLANVPGGERASYEVKCLCVREATYARLMAEVDAAHDDQTVQQLRRRLDPLMRELILAGSRALKGFHPNYRPTPPGTPRQEPRRSENSQARSMGP